MVEIVSVPDQKNVAPNLPFVEKKPGKLPLPPPRMFQVTSAFQNLKVATPSPSKEELKAKLKWFELKMEATESMLGETVAKLEATESTLGETVSTLKAKLKATESTLGETVAKLEATESTLGETVSKLRTTESTLGETVSTLKAKLEASEQANYGKIRLMLWEPSTTWNKDVKEFLTHNNWLGKRLDKVEITNTTSYCNILKKCIAKLQGAPKEQEMYLPFARALNEILKINGWKFTVFANVHRKEGEKYCDIVGLKESRDRSGLCPYSEKILFVELKKDLLTNDQGGLNSNGLDTVLQLCQQAYCSQCKGFPLSQKHYGNHGKTFGIVANPFEIFFLSIQIETKDKMRVEYQSLPMPYILDKENMDKQKLEDQQDQLEAIVKHLIAFSQSEFILRANGANRPEFWPDQEELEEKLSTTSNSDYHHIQMVLFTNHAILYQAENKIDGSKIAVKAKETVGDEITILKKLEPLKCPFLPRLCFEFVLNSIQFVGMTPLGIPLAAIQQNFLNNAAMVIKVAVQLLEALQSIKIAHRDIFIRNIIWVPKEEHIVLIDFDVSDSTNGCDHSDFINVVNVLGSLYGDEKEGDFLNCLLDQFHIDLIESAQKPSTVAQNYAQQFQNFLQPSAKKETEHLQKSPH